MSTKPREQLPTSLDQDGAKILCRIESILRGKRVDTMLKNRHWYSKGERYLRVRFDLRVILGPADIKFQIQPKGNVVFSKDYDAIQIRWDPRDFLDAPTAIETPQAAISRSLIFEGPGHRKILSATSLESSLWTAPTTTRDLEISTVGSIGTADSSYPRSAAIQDQMTQVSQHISNGLQSSVTNTPSITLFIHSNFHQYFREELHTGQTLDQVLVLSGNAEKAYAASYAQYVQWLWPETGLWVLQMMKRVVDARRYRKLSI